MKTNTIWLIGLLIANIVLAYSSYNQDTIIKVLTLKVTELQETTADTEKLDNIDKDLNLTINYLSKTTKMLADWLDIIQAQVKSNQEIMNGNTEIYNKKFTDVENVINYLLNN